MVKEWHWYAGKHGLGPARLQYALGVGERALSLSSPIESPAERLRDKAAEALFAYDAKKLDTEDFLNEVEKIYGVKWTAQASSEVREAQLDEFKELFYEAFTEDRDADMNSDPLTLGERCKKYAAKAVLLCKSNLKGETDGQSV